MSGNAATKSKLNIALILLTSDADAALDSLSLFTFPVCAAPEMKLNEKSNFLLYGSLIKCLKKKLTEKQKIIKELPQQQQLPSVNWFDKLPCQSKSHLSLSKHSYF